MYSWPATYSWILHQNWLLTKAVHARLKSLSVQSDGQAIFVVLPWRQADQVPVSQKRIALWGAAGLRTREVLTEALQPHLGEHRRTRSSTAGHTYLCGLAESGPRSWTAKMYLSCLLLFWEFTFAVCFTRSWFQLQHYYCRPLFHSLFFFFIYILLCSAALVKILLLQWSILVNSWINAWRHE